MIALFCRIDFIDPALRRPGRFERELFVGLPTQQNRLSILTQITSKWNCPPSAAFLQTLASKTDKFSGADLKVTCSRLLTKSVILTGAMQ